jgi:hypothetical protein
MDVCKDHSALVVEVGHLTETVTTLNKAMMGEDMRGGVILDIAVIKGSIEKITTYIDSQQKKDTTQSAENRQEAKNEKNIMREWSFRKQVIVYTGICTLSVSLVMFFVEMAVSMVVKGSP